MVDPYIPLSKPFWTDGIYQVHERSEGRYTASRINGSIHFQGSLSSCAQWLEREMRKNEASR